jgi:hypothetical protein
MAKPLMKAARDSALPKPNEFFIEGGLLAMICANKAKPKEAASVTMCPASDIKAKELAQKPAKASIPANVKVSNKAVNKMPV